VWCSGGVADDHFGVLFFLQVPPSTHNILFPSAAAAVPYIIRARQCLVMHTVGRMQVSFIFISIIAAYAF